ncbi:MAG: excinuclease ABC subunit UvrB [bacterium]|nr:excinuclease ABC subunit UvrB [bacterium]
MSFKLVSQFEPSGDQPRAIKTLTDGLREGKRSQTLLGVTGSGKTFSMAQVIAATNRPALVLSHNKTLAAQLYEEFRDFFPQNSVHYFVSYYDYYQPEAYIPNTDTYIEKDAKINSFIDELRHATTQAALTRKDLIIVASVSAIYGIGEPETYLDFSLNLEEGKRMDVKEFTSSLADMQYIRNDIERTPGTWGRTGEAITVVLPSGERVVRIIFFGGEIEEIQESLNSPDINFSRVKNYKIFPAKHFVTPLDTLETATKNIEKELKDRVLELKKSGKEFEAERLLRRARYDIKMLRETGYTQGIENYSRHLTGRAAGEPPATLLEYLPDNFLTFVDESHITLPQIRGMFAGDRARKETLVEHGFRLPSALDNRPLTFEEFEKNIGDAIFVSATPGLYERARGNIAEQLIRPTGLLDPTIEVRGAEHQVKDVEKEIVKRAKKNERTLVIALTKRMAEDIAEYLSDRGLKVAWLHSEVKTIERHDILRSLRDGTVDAIVGINLLREGLDLPEVSLICILDADKEGFLRNETTLIQTAGRASRNPEGHVIFYADKITESMKKTIDETSRRRKYQELYNKKNKITPTAIHKDIKPSLFAGMKKLKKENVLRELSKEKRSKIEQRREIEDEMLEAASRLDFERAAELRDILKSL